MTTMYQLKYSGTLAALANNATNVADKREIDDHFDAYITHIEKLGVNVDYNDHQTTYVDNLEESDVDFPDFWSWYNQ